MNSLSFNTEQQNKFLEMCKSLFPEYHFRWDGHYPRTLNIYGYNGHEDERLIMHWFEFLMIHLAKKVIPKFNINNTKDGDIDDFDLDYRGICFGYLYPKMEIHPIDYLYEIFKNSTQKII